MSSKTRYVPVKMVRIQWPDKKQPITHRDNVTVGIPKDSQTNTSYLRIAVNQKTILSDELEQFKWLDECSADGVATIDSSSMKIIIIYDANDRISRDFIAEMKALLQHGSHYPSPTQDQPELTIDDLVKFIEEGSSNGAERAAKYLARSRAIVQFNLINHNDDEENESTTKKSEAEAPFNILQLKVRIECHLNTDPVVTTIFVRSGTDLRSLKEQIETETGISRRDQYWYAFDRYIISDEYVFGSADPVVPPRKINAPRKQATSPTDPIRSGDTLIMYIAQIRPYK